MNTDIFGCKKSGILVREFSVGMGPKIVDLKRRGTTFTLRILPIGGYVRMAGLDEEDGELKAGQPVVLTTNSAGVVTTINTSEKFRSAVGVPLIVTKFDLQDALFIEGYENGDEGATKRFAVDHDATIVEKMEPKYESLPVTYSSNQHRFGADY